MSKNATYDKDGMIKLLEGLQGHLSQHTAKYPALGPVIKAMTEAIKDPTVVPESMRLPAASGQTKETRPVKPVNISYQGEEIVVKGVPWGPAHYAMNKIFGVPKEGTFHSAPGKPWDGEQVFKSCRDKKTKSYRLPLEKLADVLAYFRGENIPVRQI